MTKIDPKQGWLLVGGLFAIGLGIHGCHIALEQRFPSLGTPRYQPQEVRVANTPPPPTISRPSVPTEPPKPREKTPEELAEEHRQFLVQYYDPAFTRTPGKAAVALAVVSDQGTRPITEALTQRFQGIGIQLLPAFFKAKFSTDGSLARIVSGDTEAIEKLDLAKVLDGLLLADESVEYEDNPQLENVISAHLHLQVVALPLTSGRQTQTWTFTANGAGFNNNAARTMAEERLAKQISNATNLNASTAYTTTQ